MKPCPNVSMAPFQKYVVWLARAVYHCSSKDSLVVESNGAGAGGDRSQAVSGRVDCSTLLQYHMKYCNLEILLIKFLEWSNFMNISGTFETRPVGLIREVSFLKWLLVRTFAYVGGPVGSVSLQRCPYFVDEMFLAGEVRETSQQKVLQQLRYLNTLEWHTHTCILVTVVPMYIRSYHQVGILFLEQREICNCHCV